MNDYCAHIFESELRAMCFQASRFPNSETGGDLYGTWTFGNKPIVFLATGPGPNAFADTTRFFQDNEYIMENERILFENFGIQYLGDWHSHHILNLHNPSSGDQRRIKNLMVKSKRNNMLEIIITHVKYPSSDNPENPLQERISAYQYEQVSSFQMNHCDIDILRTQNSVIRQYIQSTREFSNINLMQISPKLLINNIQLSNSIINKSCINPEISCFWDIISPLRLR